LSGSGPDEIIPFTRFVRFLRGISEMKPEHIEVDSYCGRRGDERPVSFVYRGQRIEVRSVISQWIEENRDDRRQRRFFRIEASDGCIHILFCDLEAGVWFHASRRCGDGSWVPS
jgi:hypothetical protein